MINSALARQKSLKYSLLITIFMLIFQGCSSKKIESETTESNSGSKVETQEKDLWGGLDGVKFGTKLSEASHAFVFLHGLGGNADNMKNICNNIQTSPKTAFVFLNGPFQARNPGGRAWMLKRGDFEKSRSKVLTVLKSVRAAYPKLEIILGGYSQGAILSSNLISEAPGLVSAVILISPSGNVRYEPREDVIDKPLVFLTHGRDDRVLPFQGSETLHQKLTEKGYEVDWFPYEGGHAPVLEIFPRLNKFLARVQSAEEGDSTNSENSEKSFEANR